MLLLVSILFYFLIAWLRLYLKLGSVAYFTFTISLKLMFYYKAWDLMVFFQLIGRRFFVIFPSNNFLRKGFIHLPYLLFVIL